MKQRTYRTCPNGEYSKGFRSYNSNDRQLRETNIKQDRVNFHVDMIQIQNGRLRQCPERQQTCRVLE